MILVLGKSRWRARARCAGYIGSPWQATIRERALLRLEPHSEFFVNKTEGRSVYSRGSLTSTFDYNVLDLLGIRVNKGQALGAPTRSTALWLLPQSMLSGVERSWWLKYFDRFQSLSDFLA